MSNETNGENFGELFEQTAESSDFSEFERAKRSDIAMNNAPRARRSRPRFRTSKLSKVQVGSGQTIDLHRNTRDVAKKRIQGFIERCKMEQVRVVRIITGCGLGSKEGPVIKPMTEELLEVLKHKREIIHFILEDTGGSFIVQLR